MTSSCSTDSVLHSLVLGSEGTEGESLTWKSEDSPGLLRRRGTGMVRLEATHGQSEGKLMIFGGAVDQYVCCESIQY